MSANFFSGLKPVEPDALLALIALANADQRPDKMDLGVGVFRDSEGATPIPRAVKEAERRLWKSQETKAYLGGAGDVGFVEQLRPILFAERAADKRIRGVQTPGGCGALRMGFELIARANPEARVLLGTPTWPNHPPVADACGLEVIRYDYYDRGSHSIRFADMLNVLRAAKPGDVVLLQACCHNPIGADLSLPQWQEIAAVVGERGLLPFIDNAYQGLGEGLEEDALGMRAVVAAASEALVAQSCDKNFGVYRDRVGSLFVQAADAEQAAILFSNMLQLARANYSMPPDHGAATVRLVLEDEALRADWMAELDSMRGRINSLRARIAALDPRLAYIGEQRGMFSMLPLTPRQVLALRERHAIYMADSGRFNICGLADDQVERFVAAVIEVIES